MEGFFQYVVSTPPEEVFSCPSPQEKSHISHFVKYVLLRKQHIGSHIISVGIWFTREDLSAAAKTAKQSQKYLLPGSSQKNLTDHWSKYILRAYA